MRHRFTIKELNEMTDDEIFFQLCVDRQTTCTNVYSPLFTKLSQIINRLREKIDKEKEEYKANFLWPAEKGSVEEAGYEFANAKTENYRKKWWMILLVKIQEIEKLDETKN